MRILGLSGSLLVVSGVIWAQFAPTSYSPITVGTSPMSVAAGDFNSDGYLDLAVANSGSNSITVLLGTAAGGFTPANGSPISVGNGPVAIAAGDFNGDGILDLAIVNEYDDDVTVLLGDGTGGFSPANGSPFSVGGYPVSLVVADFNNDGILDLATANSSDDTVSVLLGNGAGGFVPAPDSPITVGGQPDAVSAADLNLDGNVDLAVANGGDGTVTVLLGNGTGAFAAGNPISVGTAPASVAVADFNGDGKPDLAVANSGDNTVSILLGDGSGAFAPVSTTPLTVGKQPLFIVTGDFNGDGNADLAIANGGDNTVTVLLGNGTGAFNPAPQSPYGVGNDPDSLAIGDFNGDGNPDLAVTNQADNTVTILLNGLTGTCRILTSSATLAFQAPFGGAQVKRNLGISSSEECGSDFAIEALNWNEPWFSVLNFVAGKTLGLQNPLIFGANPAGLTPGLHQNTLIITGQGAVNNPLKVPVTFALTTQPLPDAYLGQSYTASIGNYSCSLASGTPPPPLQVTVLNGVCSVTGVPSELGQYQFVIQYPGGQAGYEISVYSTPPPLQVTATVSATSPDTSTAPVVLPPVTLTNTSSISVSFTASIQPTSLYSISPAGGSLSGGASMQLTVTFNPSGQAVAPGYYTGTYTVANTVFISGETRPEKLPSIAGSLDHSQPRASSGNTSIEGGTALTTITASLQFTPSVLTFTYPGQQLSFTVQEAPNTVQTSPFNSVSFTVSYADNSAGDGAVNVLSQAYTITNAQSALVEATAASLGPQPGPWTGEIVVSCMNVSCGALAPAEPVNLMPPPPPSGPTLHAGSVANAANYSTQGIAPGSIVAIYGANLASQSLVSSSIPLGTTLDIVSSVTFNGFPAGLYYVSPTQINAQVPWEVLQSGNANGTVDVVVTTNAGTSLPVTINTLPAVPGIFTADASGSGQAIATDNNTYLIAAPTAPISISSGHALIIWCTGLGDVTPSIADDVNSINPDGSYTLRNTVLQPTVTVGGVPAQFIYSILSPQYVSEYQIAVLLDPSTPTGDNVPLAVTVNGISAGNNVTIAVAP